ncbi:sensor histidine kinase [Zavarzinia sp.]|uniref:sensor histidine kinase n=1 Tax=Zavarzinia sp. TaxID=2027920 RepID=UPI003BB4952A
MGRSLAGAIARALVAANLIALVGITIGFAISGLADRRNRFQDGVDEVASVIEDAIGRDAQGRLSMNFDDPDWRAVMAKHEDILFLVLDPQSGEEVGNDGGALHRAIGDRWLREWRRSIFSLSLPGHAALQGTAMTISLDETPLRLAVAYDENDWQGIRSWVGNEFAKEIAPTAVPALLISLVVALLAVRRVMRPVADVAARLSRLDPTRGDARLDALSLPAEIAPLVGAVNDSFDRVAAAFEHERRFLSDAAHELKTPIAVLRARIDGLSDRAIAERLTADVDRLGKIVDRLLTSARIEQGRAAMKPLDLGALGRTVVAEYAPLALAKSCEIEWQAEDAPLPLMGDAELLAEALRNLVGNALRFSPEGGLIEVAAAFMEAGRQIVVEVRDRGPGLPPGSADRIFTPFVSSAPSGSGHAGLGLAIVAAVARRHEGRAEAEDRPGGGAIFRLVMPAMLSPAAGT